MTLQEALDFLKTAKPEEVITGLQNHLHGTVYQVIYQKGFDTATARADERVTAAQAALTAAERKVTERDTRVAELERKAPDSAALKAEYETRENVLKEQHKTELQKAQQALEAERWSSVRKDLRREFTDTVEGLGMDPIIADSILVQPDVRERFQWNTKGEPEVLQLGTKVPIQPTDKKTAVRLLAEELSKPVDKKYFKAKGDGGAGATGAGAGGTGSGGKSVVEQTLEANRSRANAPNPLRPAAPAPATTPAATPAGATR
jgi:hypothetical protein